MNGSEAATRHALAKTCDAQLEQVRVHLAALDSETKRERKRLLAILRLKASWGLYESEYGSLDKNTDGSIPRIS